MKKRNLNEAQNEIVEKLLSEKKRVYFNDRGELFTEESYAVQAGISYTEITELLQEPKEENTEVEPQTPIEVAADLKINK